MGNTAEGGGEERNKGIQYGDGDFVDKTKIEIIVSKDQVRALWFVSCSLALVYGSLWLEFPCLCLYLILKQSHERNTRRSVHKLRTSRAFPKC